MELLFSSSQPREDRIYSLLRDDEGKRSEFIDAIDQHITSLEQSLNMLSAAFEEQYLPAKLIFLQNGDEMDGRHLIRELVAYIELAKLLTVGNVDGSAFPQIAEKAVLHFRTARGETLFVVESMLGLDDELGWLIPELEESRSSAHKELERDPDNATLKTEFTAADKVLEKANMANEKNGMISDKAKRLVKSLYSAYEEIGKAAALNPTQPATYPKPTKSTEVCAPSQISCRGTTVTFDHQYRTSLKEVSD